MNKETRKKYDLIAKISGVVIGLVLVLGISYAVFRTTTMGDKDNVVNAGKLDVRVENEANEITIPNALPQTEEAGKASTPYTFDIVNEGTIDAMYDLYIELSDDTTLKDNDIRYYLTKTVDGTETPIDDKASHYLSDALDTEKKEKKLYRIDINDELKTKDKVSYKLYLWIDYDATSEDATNKVFKANIRVDASQLVERNETLLRKVDVSENSDGSAYAYVYDDGTLKIKGTGNLASGIDDMDIYASNPTKVLKAYKKVLSSMGYDVSNITTMDEFNTFVEEQSTSDSSFDDNFNLQLELTSYKETLEEMGYTDTESITDINTLMTYMQNKGLMDSDGNFTTEGETVQTKAEEIYNTTYADTVSIKDVIIEEGITNIPEGLYTGNSDITSVTIPSSVTSIDDEAFYNCINLTSINVDESNLNYTSVDGVLFNKDKTELISYPRGKTDSSYTIPSTVTSIGNSAFNSCTSLTSIEIPSSVISIGNNAFSYCTGLTSLEIPSGVTSIGNSAFSSCTGITSITIPNSVASIGKLAFYGCSGLISIELPNSVTNIGYSAFVNCSGLTSIELPNSITSIEMYTFSGCTSLTELTIPNSITNIEKNSFKGCSGITKLTIDGTKDYGDLGASNITDLTITGTGNMYNYNGSSSSRPWYSSRTEIKNVTISDTITSIGTYGFYSCTSLISIEIPNSVTEIGKAAFDGCTSLTDITIPSSVTSIGQFSFDDCTSLISIEIPSSVTSIGSNAFSGCTGLTSVAFKENSQLTTIEVSVFSGCTSLASIEIPSSVTSIKNYAFQNCTSLSSITIPNSVTSTGQKIFNNWTSSQTINIDNTKSYVKSNFNYYWNSGCSATINYLRT